MFSIIVCQEKEKQDHNETLLYIYLMGQILKIWANQVLERM